MQAVRLPAREGAGGKRRCCAWGPSFARAAAVGAALVACLALGWSTPARAIELCSAEARALMQAVRITPDQIDALCERAARSGAPLTLGIGRRQEDLGYCRITLELHNNTTLHLNALGLSVRAAGFQPFQFRNVPPGGTGYASARSRAPLPCKELAAAGLEFHWPASLRIGDRSPVGRQLLYYRPILLDPVLAWSDQSDGNAP